MVVKPLLISGNLPEDGITFCCKPQSCQKPGFPRMTSLCAAEQQSACSAGCQGAEREGRSGRAGDPRAEVWGARGSLPGAPAGHDPGAGLLLSAGRFAGLTGSACSCLGQEVLSLGLAGLLFLLFSVFTKRSSVLPNPLIHRALLAWLRQRRCPGTRGKGGCGQCCASGLSDAQGVFAEHINCWELPRFLKKSETLSSYPWRRSEQGGPVRNGLLSKAGGMGAFPPRAAPSAAVPGRLRVPALRGGGRGRGVNNTDPLRRCLSKINEC